MQTASDASKLFKDIEGFQSIAWPEEFPFNDEKFFARADESPDVLFYQEPRFVTHIDDGAIAAASQYSSNEVVAAAKARVSRTSTRRVSSHARANSDAPHRHKQRSGAGGV